VPPVASCLKTSSANSSILSNRYTKKDIYYIKGIKDKLFPDAGQDIYDKVFYLPLLHNERIIIAKVRLENLGQSHMS